MKNVIQGTTLSGTGAVSIAPGAEITIRNPAGQLVPLWADRAGTQPHDNPFLTDSEGQFRVYADSGWVHVRAQKDGSVREWRYVPLGSAAAMDIGEVYAALGSEIYSSVAGGLSESAEGDYFLVESEGALDLYRVVNGVAEQRELGIEADAILATRAYADGVAAEAESNATNAAVAAASAAYQQATVYSDSQLQAHRESDDHDHRYYTKTEVDQALGTKVDDDDPRLSDPRTVATIAELRSAPTNRPVLVAEEGRGGTFTWHEGDFSAKVAADPLAGIYVPSDSDPTGESGCWVRLFAMEDGIHADWFGAVPREGVDSYPAIQAALTHAASAASEPVSLTVNLGAGAYYCSKPLVFPDKSGVCPSLRGLGAFKTELIKTTNDVSDDATAPAVDAYIVFKDRGPSLFNYKANLYGIRFRRTAPNRIKYGIYGQKLSSCQWEDIDVYEVEDGFYTETAWMMNYKAVRIHDCYRGFVWNGGGTSNTLENCWVEYARDVAYDIYGLTYSTFINCGADHVFDPADLTAHKVAYKQNVTWALTFIGCGAEDVRGSLFQATYGTFRVEGFRMYGIKFSQAGQNLLDLQSSFAEFSTCHFAHFDGGVTTENKANITALSQNSTNRVSFSNCRWDLANAGVPADAYANERALVSNMDIEVNGLRTAKVNMHHSTWQPLCKMAPNSRIHFLSASAKGADRYIEFAPAGGLFWGSISTDPDTPTKLGDYRHSGGVVSGAHPQIYRDVAGTVYVKNSTTGENREFSFVFHTPQHWA